MKNKPKEESEHCELEEMLYINEKGKWTSGEVPRKGDMVIHRVRKTWSDIWWYYANVIDYVRILMGVLALVVIMNAPEWKLLIAALIFGSVLLDWVDGPIARKYNQSTVMGCGWDWLGDLLAQYCLAIWSIQSSSPIATFVVLFTVVEITCGLFDFAASAQSVYPSQPAVAPWYCAAENWLTPGGTYNNLGIACWLINTLYPIGYCIGLPAAVCRTMMPFAVLYAWHECCQVEFMVSNWRETTASFAPGNLYMRKCSDDEINIITSTHEKAVAVFQKEAPAIKDIYWLNIYNNGKIHPSYEGDSKLHDMVHSMIREFYHGKRFILSYGFTIAPAHGNTTQLWHFDYHRSGSNIFIPLTRVTEKNATQYLRFLGGAPKAEPEKNSYGNFEKDASVLMKDEGLDHIEVSQTLCDAYSILKLTPQCIHRGIANKEDYDRVLFFICTADRELDLREEHSANIAMTVEADAKVHLSDIDLVNNNSN